MKASDYIINFLVKKNITDMFGYPGAVVCHIMDSAEKNENMNLHLCYHEQSAAFAACGYALSSGRVGVAYATGGPGATNLVTGIADAWYDSLPTIFIVGQVDTMMMRGDLPIRQKGIQEIPTSEMVKSICKYSALVESPDRLQYYMERAYWEATNGRPGPVVLEIPADIQRADISIDASDGYISEKAFDNRLADIGEVILRELEAAKRPCLLVGNGVKVTGLREEFKKLAELLKIPIVFSLPAFDLLPFDHPYNFGFIGNNGNRYSNFILGKSDLIVTIGTRLDVKQVGTVRKDFALNAKLIRVDIDQGELAYKVREDELPFIADLHLLLPYLLQNGKTLVLPHWLNTCRILKEKLYGYDFCNYHRLIQATCDIAPTNSCFSADVGQHEIYMVQALKVKEGQRILLSTGLASMGFALPASIGAVYGKKAPVICICGDGGFQMNMQELQFLVRENLSVKVVVFNNNALGMIREFQERNFEKKYTHSVEAGGYTIPEINKIANAFNISYKRIECIEDIDKLDFSLSGPEIIEIIVTEPTYLYPRLSRGQTICDMIPELNQDLYNELMSL